MLLRLLAFASAILAAPAENNNLTTRDEHLDVYYYNDNNCTKWTAIVQPKLGGCYAYQWNGMNSANIVKCYYYGQCRCQFFQTNDCYNLVADIYVNEALQDQKGTHNCANAQGVGIQSMKCSIIG